MDGSHWIGSIAFELRAPDAGALDPFRRALKSDHDHLLRRPLQQALDDADRSGTLVRHRRIEIDLGMFGPDEWGDQLARRIADGIARRITVAGLEAERTFGRAATEAELLLSFLRAGTLSWPCSGQALEAICLALAGRDEASFAWLAAQLKALFADRPEAAGRFVRQCPAELVLRIAASFAGLKARHARTGKPIAQYVGEAAAPGLAAMLIRLARGEEATDLELRWLDVMIGGGVAGALPQMPGAEPVAALAAAAPAGVRQVDPRVENGEPRSAKVDANANEVIAARGLPLEAAGAILLHPFLVGLFKEVGLLDDQGAFLTEDHRTRAVLLLNYAATGEQEQAEPELVLAKLLCGMEFQTAVARIIEPSELECSEVESLLRAAIVHWGALGETSPPALRETFLKRPGQLQCDGDDWRLVVEQRGVDVLLDRLPWAIGLVKTPFMARPLRIDWR